MKRRTFFGWIVGALGGLVSVPKAKAKMGAPVKLNVVWQSKISGEMLLFRGGPYLFMANVYVVQDEGKGFCILAKGARHSFWAPELPSSFRSLNEAKAAVPALLRSVDRAMVAALEERA